MKTVDDYVRIYGEDYRQLIADHMQWLKEHQPESTAEDQDWFIANTIEFAKLSGHE